MMDITAPATPDELRTRLTATPSADAVKATPISASLGTSPAGLTRAMDDTFAVGRVTYCDELDGDGAATLRGLHDIVTTTEA